MTVYLLISGLILCIVLSAFFSASEMSYSSCNELRIENLKKENNKKADRAIKIITDFDKSLSAILIGNNLVNIAASSIGSVLIIELLGTDKFAWISTILVTVLVIIFGETIPKIIAKKKSNHFALSFSLPIRVLTFIFTPIIKIVIFLIKPFTGKVKAEEAPDDEEAIEELASIIETAEDEEVLDEEQSELVQAAIDFLDGSAMDSMTSRVDIISIDIDDPLSAAEKIIFDSGYSRIPVYKDSIDNIIGILHVNHYLKAKTKSKTVDINTLLMKPCYVYKTTKLTSVLEQLRLASQHMAIVCDEYGGTLGIVTMEDILEEIVGDIWDEKDIIEEDVKEISDLKYELDGDITIGEFCELLDINEDEFETDSDTVGGWVLEHFETYPQNGEEFSYNDYCIRILDIEDRRINKILLQKI